MPRKPKLRVNYTADAQYLLRLHRSIEEDYSRPKEWRQETIEMIQALHIRLLMAPEPESPNVAPSVESEDRDSQKRH
jgi:hypothetical protein